MKSCDFAYALKALSELLDTAGASASAEHVLTLSRLFDKAPTSSVSALITSLGAIPVQKKEGGPVLGELLHVVQSFGSLLELVGRQDVKADLTKLERLLETHKTVELSIFLAGADSLVAASKTRQSKEVNDELISIYREKLEANLTNHDNFSAIYNELAANENMGKEELVTLAKELTQTTVRSRAQALKKIWNRHQNLMEVRRKAEATGGRSAA
jgi:hypothetical protein